MKKYLFLTIALFLMMFTYVQGYAQKKRESAKERKARIEKLVEDATKEKTFFVAVGRIFPKSGVAQNVVFSNDGFFFNVEKDKLSCNAPYIGQSERNANTAYNTQTNLHLFAENQIITLFGGWQEKMKSYVYKTVFWNNNNSKGVDAIQIVLTIQIYKSGKVYVKADVPNMEPITYEGEISEKPAPPEPMM